MIRKDAQKTGFRAGRRRTIRNLFMAATGTSLIASSTGHSEPGQNPDKKPLLVTNQYPWGTFYKRQGLSWQENLDEALSEIKRSGADSLEPLVDSMEQLELLSEKLVRNELAMKTVYMNSVLHEKESSEKSIHNILSLAARARRLMGTSIVVTNPSPIRWGGDEDKTDEQLIIQGKAMDTLGKALAEQGVMLAYHFHNMEFRKGAREVHHMLGSTNPDYVKLCLDAHWVYRGAGDSNVTLHDIVKLYGSRVVELHVRQSNNGIWTEAFGEGDIDYKRLVNELVKIGVNPVVCMEQAVEAGSPNTLNGLEAHKISHAEARRVFAPFLA